MEPKPGGGVACFAYKRMRDLSPADHAFYPSREAAERGCEQSWGVPAGSWRTDRSRWRVTAVRFLLGSICVLGGAWLLLFTAERQDWAGLKIVLPLSFLALWFGRLSWSRLLEGGLVCLAAGCIVVVGGIAAFGLQQHQLFAHAIDLFSIVAVASLGGAATASAVSAITSWVKKRQRKRSDSSAVRRASNGV